MSKDLLGKDFIDMSEEELQKLLDYLIDKYNLKYNGKYFRYQFVPNTMLGRVKDSYLPFYDEYADFNTNAKSYYDYLARYNKILQAFEELINRALNRNILIEDTESIDFQKDGDWIDNGGCYPLNYNDEIILRAHVIISDVIKKMPFVYLGEFDIPNGSEILNDGLWSPDYKALIDDIGRRLQIIDEQIADIYEKLADIYQKIEIINNEIKNINTTVNEVTTIMGGAGTGISLNSQLTYPHPQWGKCSMVANTLNRIYGNPDQIDSNNVIANPADKYDFFTKNVFRVFVPDNIIIDVVDANFSTDWQGAQAPDGLYYCQNPIATIIGSLEYDGLLQADFAGDWSFAIYNSTDTAVTVSYNERALGGNLYTRDWLFNDDSGHVSFNLRPNEVIYQPDVINAQNVGTSTTPVRPLISTNITLPVKFKDKE